MKTTGMATRTADAVIIGGGIIGAACGYFLSAAGLDVHLVERHFPASGSSRACDGLILLWDKNGDELSLGLESTRLWAELNEKLEHKFGFGHAGTIFIAENGEQLEAGKKKAEILQQAGQAAQILSAQELQNLEPELAPDLAGGVLFPWDSQVDPRRATLALLMAARQQGLKMHTGTEVVGIKREPHGKRGVCGVITPQGEIHTPTIICAAGVWSNQIARMVGLELPIKPRKGHVLVTAKAPGLVRHPLLEGGYVTTVESAAEDLQIALVAEATNNGSLLLGSSRQFAGYDRKVSLSVIQAIAARAVRFLPKLAKTKIIRSYAGLRPWSPDNLPLIGPVSSVPGFYLATGHEGAGICLSPITGQLISKWVTKAELPIEAYAVHPKRFYEKDP